MGKVWRFGGREDNFIEKLIETGRITKNTQSSELKQSYPTMFKAFSDNVIKNHLNELKRRKNFIPTSNVPSLSVPQIIHQNYPVLCEKYNDPDTQMDMVLVAVSVPGGAQNVRFEVSNNGSSVIVKYEWPKTLYTMDDLFKKDIDAKRIPLFHPKVLAMEDGLRKCRERIDGVPEATIRINLPIKVPNQCVAGTNKSGIARDDGTKIVMAELAGFAVYKREKHSIVFDK